MHKTSILVIALTASCAFKQAPDQHEFKFLWTAGWSADGTYIAVGGDNGKLVILNGSHLAVVKTLFFDSMTIPSVAWHPTQNLLAFSAYPHNRRPETQTLQILNMATGKLMELGKYAGRGLDWSPDGRQLALGRDGFISIFSIDGEKIRDIKHPSGRSLFSVSWHPTKSIIAAADDDVRLFDTETGEEIRSVKISNINKAILCVRWHPSGNFFATGDYGHEGETEPSYLKFYSEEGEHLLTMTGSKGPYRGMEWNKHGTKLATASDSLRIWSMNGKLLVTANNGIGDIWGIDWNNNLLVTGGWENSVSIWNDNGKLLKVR